MESFQFTYMKTVPYIFQIYDNYSIQPSYFSFVWYVFGFSGQKTFSNSSLDDWSRVKYLHEYIGSMANALRYF